MLRLLFAGLFLFNIVISFSQEYTADWESLDQRAVPEWFNDAKFGIFIHWGVYSVPAYRPFPLDEYGFPKKEGTYAEWYAPDVMYKPERNDNWHEKTYGKDFSYFDFLPMFRAELFNPDQWAEMFYESGAKYVILTSKHCEGFALWPSEEKYSENWNAWDAGPRRDLLGDLTRSVRAKGMKMGYYYSFLEYWTTRTNTWPSEEGERTGYYVPNQVWEKHHIPEEDYVERVHFHIKELVQNYQPDIIWTDAEWDYTEEELRSRELLAWIYNNAPNREDVVVNDRWAKGTRGKHGGFYTTEYGTGAENISKNRPWEECRGMGYSFGYNRAEQLEDYKSSDELIRILTRTVAAGGNLLLNVGPDSDGRIPLVMQMRLKDIGAWLKVNGEAIYGTRTWTPVLPMKTVNPRAGDNVLFTKKGEDLYAFLIDWDIDAVSLKEIGLQKDATAFHLGTRRELDMKVKSGGAMIELPHNRNEVVSVIRIENAWEPEEE